MANIILMIMDNTDERVGHYTYLTYLENTVVIIWLPVTNDYYNDKILKDIELGIDMKCLERLKHVIDTFKCHVVSIQIKQNNNPEFREMDVRNCRSKLTYPFCLLSLSYNNESDFI